MRKKQLNICSSYKKGRLQCVMDLYRHRKTKQKKSSIAHEISLYKTLKRIGFPRFALLDLADNVQARTKKGTHLSYFFKDASSQFDDWLNGKLLFATNFSKKLANHPRVRYLKGVHAYNILDNKAALGHFLKIPAQSRFYRLAKIHEAHLYFRQKKAQKAVDTYRLLLTIKNAPLASAKKQEHLTRQAALNLARIAFDNGYYNASVNYYETPKKPDKLWVKSLFEQAWALFLAGDYNRALGNLHSLHSPFFEHRFEPESYLLEAIIYFWLCRYKESKHALSTFITRDMKRGKNLLAFVEKTTDSDARNFFTSVRNHVDGIDDFYITLHADILAMLADPLPIHRAIKFAKNLEKEKRRLADMPAAFQNSALGKRIFKRLQEVGEINATRAGTLIRQHLNELAETFRRSEQQAKLMYIDLMIGQKDELMGTKTRAKEKIWKNAPTKANEFLTNDTWVFDTKNEYWWDEVGHYVHETTTKCKR